MSKNTWHYSRLALAEQVIGMFETGLSSSLVFFAPRRMGKTEFLLKDILPLAQKKGFHVHYFSFLDSIDTAGEQFSLSLLSFAREVGATSTTKNLLKHVKKIGVGAVGLNAEVELKGTTSTQLDVKEIIASLAQKGRTLLLLDEIQVLALSRANQIFIASLRTALDVHKDRVNVIFTGSSREGLRRMFSRADAPFFHFGQNLAFPEFGEEFTQHLCAVFKKVSGRTLDCYALWIQFVALQKVPQLIRSLVERLVLNPTLSLDEAKQQLLLDIADDREFITIWHDCSVLEQLLLKEIASGGVEFFSTSTHQYLAHILGVKEVALSSVQSALRVLQRKGVVGKREARGKYFIDDPNFKSWLLQESQNEQATTSRKQYPGDR